MASGPEHGGHEPRKLGAKQLSLRALFVATLFAAFFARFVARYGIYVLVFVGGPLIAGALAAFLVALTVAVMDLTLTAASPRQLGRSVAWNRFVRCILVSVLGGLVIQSLAIACVFSLANAPPKFVLNSWAEGTAAFYQTFREPLVTQLMVLSPAMLGAFSLSIAQAVANRKATIAESIAPTGCLLAAMFGTAPLLLVIVWLVFFPPKPPPPGVWDENMLGLLPIAVPMWCAMGAAFGGTLGLIAATVLASVSNAQRNHFGRTVFWCAMILAAIFVTEAATRGWAGRQWHGITTSTTRQSS